MHTPKPRRVQAKVPRAAGRRRYLERYCNLRGSFRAAPRGSGSVRRRRLLVRIEMLTFCQLWRFVCFPFQKSRFTMKRVLLIIVLIGLWHRFLRARCCKGMATILTKHGEYEGTKSSCHYPLVAAPANIRAYHRIIPNVKGRRGVQRTHTDCDVAELDRVTYRIVSDVEMASAQVELRPHGFSVDERATHYGCP
ncbi:hypothetical protein F4818DRAFT_204454 [Hypoxylon cercidicola]|nr:hypothetical protein F4818DRAFT_204454 [Hypoxylon cercidicola]